LAYNFFFLPPIYTLAIADPDNAFVLVMLLGIALIVSTLAGRVREQAAIAVERTYATRRLYEFTRNLSDLATVDEVAQGIATEIHQSLRRPIIVLIARDGGLTVRAASPSECAV
jgi:two-component system sensor histidine kinase KdpD